MFNVLAVLLIVTGVKHALMLSWAFGQCFHLQGFFLAARKYWSLQGIYKEIKFTRKNTKIKGNCKDFCNLYQLQVLNQ